MVLDPPRRKVNVTRMIIFSFIPILAIYAGWRIQKFWVLLGISIVVGWGISMPIDMIIPYPYAYLVSFAASIVISVYVVRYFARKYNEKIGSIESE
jgi:hypothetical protein